jgi:glycosyltransferase involved in cell wall biosynthesis
MENLISIIIPVYNHSEHLQEVLDALLRQSYGHIEIIVVDDGSERMLRPEDFRVPLSLQVTWLRQDNRGAPAARNFGFAHSHGEYVFFCDADVVVSPDMLKRLYDGLEKDKGAAYAYSDHYFGSKRISSRIFDAEALKKNNYIPTMSLIRSVDFVKFDESVKRFQDWDLWLSMLEQGKRGVYVQGFLWKAYVHSSGMSVFLPSYAYKFPFKYFPLWYIKVKAYEKAKRIVQEKHALI